MLVNVINEIEKHIKVRHKELGNSDSPIPVYLKGNFEISREGDMVTLSYDGVLACRDWSGYRNLWNQISRELPRFFHDLVDKQDAEYRRGIGMTDKGFAATYQVNLSVVGSEAELEEEIRILQHQRGPPEFERYSE